MRFLLFVFFSSEILFAQIAGPWKTIDDNTQQLKSVVVLYETNGRLAGKVEKIFPKAGEPADPICKLCHGDMKDKPVIGLEILKNLKKKSETVWIDGEITDPENGKTYSCKIELIEGGKKLKVRGYLGFSLIGRTQVWER